MAEEHLRASLLRKTVVKHAEAVRTWQLPAANLLTSMEHTACLVAPTETQEALLLEQQAEELKLLRPPGSEASLLALLGGMGLWQAKRTLTDLWAATEEVLGLFEVLARVAEAPEPGGLLGKELVDRLKQQLKRLGGRRVQLIPLAGLPEEEQALSPAMWRRAKALELLEQLQGLAEGPSPEETAILLELQAARDFLRRLA